jgi:hypothetical protein
MEVHKIVGGAHITSFTVGGVYVDSYYDSFTMTGGVPAGAVTYEQNQNVTFAQPTPTFGDAGPWVSTNAGANPLTNPATATPPTAGSVWAYHVAAGSLARFVIHLSEVNYLASEDGGANYDVPKTVTDRYLTVTGYVDATTGNAVAADYVFERGMIYKIGAGIDGTGGIVFDEDDLSLTPNPEDVEVTVKVNVIDWVPVFYQPIL